VDIDPDWLRERFAMPGATALEIAAETGHHVSTVRSHARRLGIRMRALRADGSGLRDATAYPVRPTRSSPARRMTGASFVRSRLSSGSGVHRSVGEHGDCDGGLGVRRLTRNRWRADRPEMLLRSGAVAAIRRVNWGCGRRPRDGWINSDIVDGPGIDLVCDIRDGIPLPDDDIHYISSQHALQDLTIDEILPALVELRRILVPGGVLRLCLPDLDVLISAYLRGDADRFAVQDWRTLSGNFIAHMMWHNITRTPLTFEFTEELLGHAGFTRIERVEFRHTRSDHPDIVELDSRADESFYAEAFKE
jgi:hypothetical protein